MPDLSDRSTLSVSRNEIDQRDPTFRITPDGGQPFTVLLVQRTLNIGSEARQDIPIQVPGIATRHARLLMEGSNYRLYDLTEYSGVLVNGHPIEGSCILRDGDTVRLQDKARRGATLSYSNPVERALGSASVGKLYPLEPLPFVIGRDPNASLALDALAVSWRHAVITEQGNAHILTDQGSTNGTFVNDRRITAPYHLRLEDVIRIDQVLLVYKGKALVRLAATQRFQLDAAGVEMTYRTGFPPRPLNTMREVSLSIQPKEFVVIIGGSGSGKSTLLRALNGANRATGGKVLINGSDLYANYELYQPIIGYVPQSDIVQDSLTVYQSLLFGARLRFPNEPKASREQRIERVLEALELSDFRDRLVGRLSGGQKKRVSIALELMAEPSLLFMDEPTSGLDPGLDKSMMNTLRRLADRGHIVIVVTHTTLNIDLCDQLVFMSRGNLVYFGPPREALNFFGAHDYSEVYNRVLQSPESLQRASSETMLFERAAIQATSTSGEQIGASEAAKLWAEKYRGTPLYNQHVLKRQQQQPPQVPGETALTNRRLRGSRRGTFWQQARVLTERAIALLRRDFRTIFAMLLVLPLVGLFLGLISLDPIDKSRGQMLVSRGKPSAYLLLMDKLPLQPVAPVEAAAKPASTGDSKTGNAQGVSAVGTFAPANEAQRLLFMASLAVTLFGIFASAYTIVAEKSLFLRERMVNLRIAPYLASKVIVYSILAMISSFLLLITLSIGVRLPDHGLIMWGPLELFITMTLTAIAGVSVGILLSALNRQVNAVTYAVLALLFVQILFPGVLFKMDGALEPISRLTITRWSLEAMGGTADMAARDAEGRIVVQTTAVNPRTGKPLVGAVQPRQYFPAPPALSVTYPTTASDLLIRWGALIAFSAVFLIGASLALNRGESF